MKSDARTLDAWAPLLLGSTLRAVQRLGEGKPEHLCPSPDLGSGRRLPHKVHPVITGHDGSIEEDKREALQTKEAALVALLSTYF